MNSIAANIKVISGCHEQEFAVEGYSVEAVRRSLGELFSISPTAVARVNGLGVGPSYRLQPNDSLEFVRTQGRKGALEPDELARLQRIENRLNQIESQMPTVERLSEAIVRVADHLAPPASSIVGSKYVADRLGCTTAWVGRMAYRGMIPRKCVVAGSGSGRFWKFHRQQIDEWLIDQAGGDGT